MDQVAARVRELDAKRSDPLTEDGLRIAVLVPCYNEELTIGNVVKAFRDELPGATVYVYDNNSTDWTIAVATAAGAICRTEPQQGKGNGSRLPQELSGGSGYTLFLLRTASRPCR
jgi:cellulose synthase/poly-beta-1,6-N-acetylglucosamine synthase-like glycosyltransferase